jgi:hypothetical protein
MARFMPKAGALDEDCEPARPPASTQLPAAHGTPPTACTLRPAPCTLAPCPSQACTFACRGRWTPGCACCITSGVAPP